MNKCFSSSVIILLSNRPPMRCKRPVYAGSQISLLTPTQLWKMHFMYTHCLFCRFITVFPAFPSHVFLFALSYCHVIVTDLFLATLFHNKKRKILHIFYTKYLSFGSVAALFFRQNQCPSFCVIYLWLLIRHSYN